MTMQGMRRTQGLEVIDNNLQIRLLDKANIA